MAIEKIVYEGKRLYNSYYSISTNEETSDYIETDVITIELENKAITSEMSFESKRELYTNQNVEFIEKLDFFTNKNVEYSEFAPFIRVWELVILLQELLDQLQN